MPLYQFFCRKCQKSFELFLQMSEAKKGVLCPDCRGEDIERREGEGLVQDVSSQNACEEKDT